MPSNGLDRQKVVEALHDQESAIQETLNQLKDEFSLPLEPISDRVQRHPMVALAVAVGAGLAVGLWMSRRDRTATAQKPAPQSGINWDGYRESIAQAVVEKHASGLPVDEAVIEAMGTLPVADPSSLNAQQPADSEAPLRAFMVSTVQGILSSALSIGVTFLKSWLSDYIKTARSERP